MSILRTAVARQFEKIPRLHFWFGLEAAFQRAILSSMFRRHFILQQPCTQVDRLDKHQHSILLDSGYLVSRIRRSAGMQECGRRGQSFRVSLCLQELNLTPSFLQCLCLWLYTCLIALSGAWSQVRLRCSCSLMPSVDVILAPPRFPEIHHPCCPL